MAVSKRTRFEIFRRDNHTCQYCGRKAPDVVLHADHVIPVALGGDDKRHLVEVEKLFPNLLSRVDTAACHRAFNIAGRRIREQEEDGG